MSLNKKILFTITEQGETLDGFKTEIQQGQPTLFEVYEDSEGYGFTVETFVGFPDSDGCITYVRGICKNEQFI